MSLEDQRVPAWLYFAAKSDLKRSITTTTKRTTARLCACGGIAANEQVLPMVGELKNLRLATEVHYLFKD